MIATAQLFKAVSCLAKQTHTKRESLSDVSTKQRRLKIFSLQLIMVNSYVIGIIQSSFNENAHQCERKVLRRRKLHKRLCIFWRVLLITARKNYSSKMIGQFPSNFFVNQIFRQTKLVCQPPSSTSNIAVHGQTSVWQTSV